MKKQIQIPEQVRDDMELIKQYWHLLSDVDRFFFKTQVTINARAIARHYKRLSNENHY